MIGAGRVFEAVDNGSEFLRSRPGFDERALQVDMRLSSSLSRVIIRTTGLLTKCTGVVLRIRGICTAGRLRKAWAGLVRSTRHK